MKALSISNPGFLASIKKVVVAPPTGSGPGVDAGVDRSMTYPTSSLTMIGSATGTGTITYKWTKISGPFSYSMVNDTDPGTVLQELTEGTYVFRLTATDSTGTAYDDMQVVVNANAAAITQPSGTTATVNYKRITFTADNSTDYDTWNFVEKLPAGYNPNGSTYYPIIIYWPMLGNEGRDFNMITENGPHKWMKSVFSNGNTNTEIWDGKVVSSGTTYDPIIISLQPITAWPENKWLVGAFNYVLNNYKVDLGRVYLTGGSMGGWSTLRIWSYDQTTANKITAFVTASAVAPCNSPFTCLQKTMNGNALMYWQSNENPYPNIATDNPQMVSVIQTYNSGKTDAVIGTQTNIGDGSHGYWDSWFRPSIDQPTVAGLPAYKNYEWFFTKQFS